MWKVKTSVIPSEWIFNVICKQTSNSLFCSLEIDGDQQ